MNFEIRKMQKIFKNDYHNSKINFLKHCSNCNFFVETDSLLARKSITPGFTEYLKLG